MAAIKGRLHADLAIPLAYVGELVAASLRSKGWQQLNYNDMVREISAELKKSDRRSGMTFQRDYKLSATWKMHDEKRVRIVIEVQDASGNARTQDCQQAAFDVLEGVNERLSTLEETLKNAKPRTTYGRAKWATAEDLKKAGYEVDNADGNVLILGPGENGKKIVIPAEDTYRHSMVCGPTGCGKSSSIFKPNLFERTKVSAIVTEATAGAEPPDLYHTTAGYRAQQGSKIYYFNPDDLKSVCINPLDVVTTVAKAQEITDLIMKNTMMTKNTGGTDFWESCERHLITALLMHVGPEGGDLAAVRALVREGAEGVGRVLETSRVKDAREEYKAFLKNSTEQIRNGVLAGVLQRLRLWINPRIAALTSKTDFDLKTLREELFTFYLVVPAQKENVKPVAALIFNYLLKEVACSTEEKTQHPLALFLDEFTNFGMIPGIAKNLTLLRHNEIPVMFGIQDYVQLRSVYGDDDATIFFGQPATRVIFRTPDLATARKVSESLGKETAVDRTLTTTCQVNEKEFARDLMSPADIMSMEKEQSVFFTPGAGNILMKRFSWKDYEEQLKIPEPEREALVIDEELIKKCKTQDIETDWEQAWEKEQEKMRKEAQKTSKPTADAKPAAEEIKTMPAEEKQTNKNSQDEEEEPDLPI